MKNGSNRPHPADDVSVPSGEGLVSGGDCAKIVTEQKEGEGER